MKLLALAAFAAVVTYQCADAQTAVPTSWPLGYVESGSTTIGSNPPTGSSRVTSYGAVSFALRVIPNTVLQTFIGSVFGADSVTSTNAAYDYQGIARFEFKKAKSGEVRFDSAQDDTIPPPGCAVPPVRFADYVSKYDAPLGTLHIFYKLHFMYDYCVTDVKIIFHQTM